MLTREKGRLAEEQALTYLIAQGMQPIAQNYYCKMGEIDLVMRDKEHLVFIEVRARASASFGGGVASITYAKKQKIIKSALHYMSKHKVHNQWAMRFDVISVDGHSASITWIKDAFGMDY
ncbi:MAG: YraN family protein [Legionella sp.]|uniref:YraN family protein n=1 Tax=Legionella sp. TaxID=459 RepID=UPI0039E29E84